MNSSPFDRSTFQAFGLDERAARIYLAALELGQALQLPLAKKAGIKRTTLRELLPSLLERGILQEVVRGKRKYLVARDPRELIAQQEQQLAGAQQALPALLAVQNSLAVKPQVRFYEGIEGVKQVFAETLRIGQPIYSFVNVAQIHPELERWLVAEYVPAREARGLHNSVIVNATANVDTLIPDNAYRHNLKVSDTEYPFAMEIDVFGDCVSLNHFRTGDQPSATLIQSQSAAETLRSLHRLIWDTKAR
ncbi:hypothetical protein HY375_00550 [Candidatus Berkelbacteria bacterium]|nr:hypothetical protein [Candidatus Berkelbacteria bacterium]